MLKNILKLDGAQLLSKNEQKEVNGGRRACSSGCGIKGICCADGYCKDLINSNSCLPLEP